MLELVGQQQSLQRRRRPSQAPRGGSAALTETSRATRRAEAAALTETSRAPRESGREGHVSPFELLSAVDQVQLEYHGPWLPEGARETGFVHARPSTSHEALVVPSSGKSKIELSAAELKAFALSLCMLGTQTLAAPAL